MKQCGNIIGRPKSSYKPTPRNLYPSRSLSKLTKGGLKKRKTRAKNQTTKRPNRTRAAILRKRSYTAKKKKQKAPFNARCVTRQAWSVSTSSYESDSSCSTCKRRCRSFQGEKAEEVSCPSQSMSGSFQDSIPASKHISPDASQVNPAFEQWDLNMAQANHEPLETQGFEPPGAPPVPTNPPEKPCGNCPAYC